MNEVISQNILFWLAGAADFFLRKNHYTIFASEDEIYIRVSIAINMDRVITIVCENGNDFDEKKFRASQITIDRLSVAFKVRISWNDYIYIDLDHF